MELESGEIVWGDPLDPASDPHEPTDRSTSTAAIVVCIGVAVALIIGAALAFADDKASELPTDGPIALSVVDAHNANPTASSAKDLFDASGGLEGLSIATAVGAFDLVRFDPLDSNRLLATHRSSYGAAQNQSSNEIWRLTDSGSITQELWAPDTKHDFAHFNVDGSTTMWVHSGADGFAPRVAVQAGFTTAALYPSRFTAAVETVFALTGDGEYYSQPAGFIDLVADQGNGLVVLDDGSKYSWIDNPSPEILVAYPTDESGLTAVWDVGTLARLPDHILSGRRGQRAAISTDGSTGAMLTFAGDLQILDATNGRVERVLGRVDGVGVDQPLTLSPDGNVLVTVEADGMVGLWWTRENAEPFATFEGAAAQPRWLSEQYAPTSASAVAFDGSRVALRMAAAPDSPTKWVLVDTDVQNWASRLAE